MYGRSSAFCLALGLLALSCASDDELTPATPDVSTQEADPGTPDSPGITLAGIEASSASDHGTTDVVVTFDADLPDTTVRLVDDVAYGPSASGWEFVAEIDFGNRDRIERCAGLSDDLLPSLGDLCTTLG